MIRTITVLQDDISQGQPGKVTGCAIALAARRDLADLLLKGERDKVFVDGYLTLSEAGRLDVDSYLLRKRLIGELPEEAKLFMRAFDSNGDVEPFKFDIDLEPPE